MPNQAEHHAQHIIQPILDQSCCRESVAVSVPSYLHPKRKRYQVSGTDLRTAKMDSDFQEKEELPLNNRAVLLTRICVA